MIESTVRNKEPKESVLNYPVIMRSSKNGQVVLFSSELEGTVLVKGVRQECFEVGFHYDSWHPATSKGVWEPLEGILELKNTELR